jgi:hypothetical protein
MQSTAVPWTRNDCTPANVRSTAPVPDDEGGDAVVPLDGVRSVAVAGLELDEQAEATATSPSAHSVSKEWARSPRRPIRVIETPMLGVR